MEHKDIDAAIEAILFAAGDPVRADRIALVLGTDTDTVLERAALLSKHCENEKRGIRIVRLDASLQMCSAPEHALIISRVMETRKPPKLSQASLEALAIVAYFQPVTRAYIDQVRGVDSSYTVGTLHERGLIEQCGKLDAPGRPSLYRTSSAFLRTMGISSLDELPELPDMTGDDALLSLQSAIYALSADENEQLMISEDA